MKNLNVQMAVSVACGIALYQIGTSVTRLALELTALAFIQKQPKVKAA